MYTLWTFLHCSFLQPSPKRANKTDGIKIKIPLSGTSEPEPEKRVSQPSDMPPSGTSDTLPSLQSVASQPSVVKTQAQPTSAAVTDVPSVVSQAAPATVTSTQGSLPATATTSSTTVQGPSVSSPQVPSNPSPATGVGLRSGSVSGAGASGKPRAGKSGKKTSTKDLRPPKLTWGRLEEDVLFCSLLHRGQTTEFHFNLHHEAPDEIANNLVSVFALLEIFVNGQYFCSVVIPIAMYQA